jgi:hypothetical protein
MEFSAGAGSAMRVRSRSISTVKEIPDRDPLGQRLIDDSFLFLINAHYDQITFTLPPADYRPT